MSDAQNPSRSHLPIPSRQRTGSMYIMGDNGASAEGTFNGTFNELLNLNGLAGIETPEFLASHLDEFGGPASYNHYRNAFTGRIKGVQLDITRAESFDHLVDPEDAIRIAMARQ